MRASYPLTLIFWVLVNDKGALSFTKHLKYQLEWYFSGRIPAVTRTDASMPAATATLLSTQPGRARGQPKPPGAGAIRMLFQEGETVQAPDHAVDTAAVESAAAETATAQPITMAGEPMIMLVRHGAMTAPGENSGLRAADLLHRTAGTRPLGPDLDLTGALVPGWRAVLAATDFLQITAPDGGALYTGTLPAGREWRTRAMATQQRHGGIVVVTGIRGTIDDLVPAIVEHRAYWIRCPFTLRCRPRMTR